MKLVTDEQILGMKHGLEQGFINNGETLSPRESWIIDICVRSVIDTLERVLSDYTITKK